MAPQDWAPFEKLDPKLPHPDYPGLDVKRVKRMTREYLASVRGVDRNVGLVMKTLDDLKMTDSTMVIFTADHGYNMGHNGIWHKGNGHWVLKRDALPKPTANIPRGQRPNMYDTSIRVPTAIRWPGVIKPGTVIEQSISFLDWYPTLVAAAGAKLPKGETIRGRNFIGLLQGKKLQWDNDVFGQYSTKHQSRTHMRMFRTPKWKLVRDFLNPDRDELYNLVNDPQESTNLIKVATPAAAKVVEALHAKIIENMKKINDPVLKSIKQ